MLPYNDLDAVRACFAEFGADIACVITEAAAGNMGAVAPLPGFNAGLRAITAEHGALLVMDEVMTGFRVTPAGWYGREPVAGRPVHLRQGDERRAARGGLRRSGRGDGPAGAVRAGVPGRARCRVIPWRWRPGSRRCGRRRPTSTPCWTPTRRAWPALARRRALTDAGVAHRVQFCGNMFSVFFTDAPVPDFAAAQATETWRYPAVLPRPARRRRVPAAVGLRVLVRQRRHGRASLRPAGQCAAVRRACRCCCRSLSRSSALATSRPPAA